jgi:hypothetical protein
MRCNLYIVELKYRIDSRLVFRKLSTLENVAVEEISIDDLVALSFTVI